MRPPGLEDYQRLIRLRYGRYDVRTIKQNPIPIDEAFTRPGPATRIVS